MPETLFSFVMCGGSGTRLWPLSRADHPKQFLKLTGQRTMLGETVQRLRSPQLQELGQQINIIGGKGHLDLLLKTSVEAGVSPSQIFIEPMGRNTAPAVGVATLLATKASPAEDPLVLILPSDHRIAPHEKFAETVVAGIEAADRNQIVVFGIEPTRPATGYGYIQASADAEVSPVERFVEKPDLETAQSYLAEGGYTWNAGIFLFRASTMLEAMATHCADILEQTKAALSASIAQSPDSQTENQASPLHFDTAAYAAIRAQSIDYAVMENAQNVTVVRANFEWSDIGSFTALKEIGAKPEEDTIHGDVIAVDTRRNYMRSDGPLIGAIGVEDLTIVATPDVTLVAPLARSEDVRQIVEQLEAGDRSETKTTPWGPEGGAVPGAGQAKLSNWLSASALPYWAHHGLDHQNGGYHEVLDLEGTTLQADKRLRTMARQLHVFAEAHSDGLGNYQAQIEHGLAFLMGAPEAGLGGWHRTYTAESVPLDPIVDVYDHAFVLLAAASCKKANHSDADALAARALNVIADLKASESGYLEDDRNSLPRRANPHMHLLEAFLAWHSASGDTDALSLAADIVKLLQTRIFQKDTQILCEQFDGQLNPTADGLGHFEPGHHFEWVWLLLQFAEASSTPAVDEVIALYSSAEAVGTNPVTRLAYDKVFTTGRPAHLTSRCWPQTEKIKAAIALSRLGRTHMDFEAERSMQRLWNHFIKPSPAGMWNDVADVSGNPVSRSVPASTFYHLYGAVQAYCDHFGKRSSA